MLQCIAIDLTLTMPKLNPIHNIENPKNLKIIKNTLQFLFVFIITEDYLPLLRISVLSTFFADANFLASFDFLLSTEGGKNTNKKLIQKKYTKHTETIERNLNNLNELKMKSFYFRNFELKKQ